MKVNYSYFLNTSFFAASLHPPQLFQLHGVSCRLSAGFILPLALTGDSRGHTLCLIESVAVAVALESGIAGGALLCRGVRLLRQTFGTFGLQLRLDSLPGHFAGLNSFLAGAAYFSGLLPRAIFDRVLSCAVLTTLAGAAFAQGFLPLSFTHSLNYNLTLFQWGFGVLGFCLLTI